MEHLNYKVVKNLADAIADHLKFDNLWYMDEEKSSRILTYYIPIALWLY